ncbi:PilC/PilY family type IV pilus protein [Sinimarinibacterium sp. NLF-5-8]|uniref:PilC/PilY family type IV pilus protein n=1 Tax=Sinimarinibacterium sp. NLF-5-8 TaxID=2698684 RepID=UPI00137BD73D|nr:PilC/PilY family type IV pilus protein [Sinimarinibacterium sp. NLF-5-8]QHS09185.1 pilus assembly protein [Sinimarinibacterium sp. NLF-5-8]
MTNATSRPFATALLGLCISLLGGLASPPALAADAPAQVPLLTRSGNTAEPNIVFTFDDSGSMAWRFMPDEIANNDSGVSGNNRWLLTFYPTDDSTFGTSVSGSARVFVTRRGNDDRAIDLTSARMRSSAYNTIYYNPEIRYRPWYNGDGSQFPDAPPSAAWLDPMVRSGSNAKTANLMGKQNPSGVTWCRSDNTTTPNGSSVSNRTPSTCGTIADKVNTVATYSSVTQAYCSTFGGSWSSNRCNLSATKKADCTNLTGGTWASNSGCTATLKDQPSCELLATRSDVESPLTYSSGKCEKKETIAENFYPASYYNYIGDKTNGMNNAANFQAVFIDELPNSGIARGEGRDDCAPAAGDGRSCTKAQEYQNFANWFTYYRTRHFTAIGAASRAFAAQEEAMRIGYGRINQTTNTSIDGTNSKTIQRGVRRFAGSDRQAFFDWLHKAPATGGTPLRRAMDDVGRYYTRTDNKGPWGNTPGTDDRAPQLECRKSYHILMTDGYWNGDAASGSHPTGLSQTGGAPTGNVDGTAGPTITGPAGQSFTYTPGNPYKDSHTGTLADVAMYYWNRDLRPDLANRVPPDGKNPAFWQHMVNFTVGLGVDGTLFHDPDPEADDDLKKIETGTKSWPEPKADTNTAVDDLWHAAVNSRGEYLSAKDPDQFAQALSSVLADIIVRNASEGGVAAAASTLQAGNRKYVPEYNTGIWTGDVKAYTLDELGQQGLMQWSAVEKLPAHANRNIWLGTHNGSPKAKEFKWDNLSATEKSTLGGPNNNTWVNFLRGDRTLAGGTLRSRQSILGDFVNSQPIFIKGLVDQQYNLLPAGSAGRGSYKTFLASKKAREGIVMIGGNDGMLHAFADSDGSERFAFIPGSLLGGLGALTSPSYGHRYYVDGQLTEGDAYWGGAWKNVVVGSTGAGGRALFALDVTNMSAPDASTVLWELDDSSDADLGYVMSAAAIGRLQDGTFVAVVGNGPYSNDGKARLFVINLQTGAVIKKITVSNDSNNGLGGVYLIRDANQVITGAYAGDLKGKLWKFDLSSSSSNAWGVSFSGQPLFTTSSGQPITAAPQAVAHPLGGSMVVLGTGKFYDEGDQMDTASQAIYAVWDQQKLIKNAQDVFVWDSEATTVANNDATIVEQKFESKRVSGAGGASYFQIETKPLNWATHRGWTLPLTLASGQRSILPAQTLFGFVLLETMSPSSSGTINPCDNTSSGVGFNMLIDPINGAMPDEPMFDTSGDGKITSENDSGQPGNGDGSPEKDTAVAGVEGNWDGRDVILTERPCLEAGDCSVNSPCGPSSKLVSVQGATAGNMMVCVPIPPPARWWWRQLEE